jgi:hypothetical protein
LTADSLPRRLKNRRATATATARVKAATATATNDERFELCDARGR